MRCVALIKKRNNVKRSKKDVKSSSGSNKINSIIK